LRLGIPIDAHVLAFRSTSGNFIFKGTEYIEKALNLIKPSQPTYLLTFDNKGGLCSLRDRFRFVEFGFVKDQNLLIDILCAADIFLMPSIAEAFGIMAIEAMACGIPVIVFHGTSLPDVIHAPEGGIAVPYKDYEAMAKAIDTLLKDQVVFHRLVEKGLAIVNQEYTLDLYVRRHIELYESLLSLDA
jgi:glycosyltransferase involved in cell wall biosynthesis